MARTNVAAVKGAIGLFEYLAVPAADASPRTTPKPGGSGDAPEPLDEVGDLFASTSETRQDNDTYDDDTGLSGLAVLGTWLDSTTKTSNRTDTYDENTESLGHPGCLLSGATHVTEVDNETYDEDDSLEGLGSTASGLTAEAQTFVAVLKARAR